MASLQINQFPVDATNVADADLFGFEKSLGGNPEVFQTQKVRASIFKRRALARIKSSTTVRPFSDGVPVIDSDLQVTLTAGISYLISARLLFGEPNIFTRPRFSWSVPVSSYAYRDSEIYRKFRRPSTDPIDFTAPQVDTGTNEIVFSTGIFDLATRVRFTRVLAESGILPEPLEEGVDYYARRTASAGFFAHSFYLTPGNAILNTSPINLITQGSGRNLVDAQETGFLSTFQESVGYSVQTGTLGSGLIVTERWLIQPSATGVFGVQWASVGELPEDEVSLLAGSHLIVRQVS